MKRNKQKKGKQKKGERTIQNSVGFENKQSPPKILKLTLGSQKNISIIKSFYHRQVNIQHHIRQQHKT